MNAASTPMKFLLLLSILQIFVQYGNGEDVDICGSDTDTIVGNNGTLVSPNYPGDYGSDLNCAKTLSPPSGKTIEIEFLFMYIEDGSEDRCEYDSLTITVGSETDRKFCGDDIPANIIANDDVTITFTTDDSAQYQGFRIYWEINDVTPTTTVVETTTPTTTVVETSTPTTTVVETSTIQTTQQQTTIAQTNYDDVDICGSDTIVGNNGTLVSPNYPGDYGSNLNCAKTLSPPSGKTIEIEFLFMDIETANFGCISDYLTITIGSERDRKFCGAYTPSNIIANDDVTITFTTDTYRNYPGFRIYWEINDVTPTTTVVETSTIQTTQQETTIAQTNYDEAETYAYCFRAQVLGDTTQLRELADVKAAITGALNTTFQRYEEDIDNFFVNGFNVTVEPTNIDSLIINICFDQITKTADELGQIFTDNPTNGTNLNDFNECDSNYLGCDEEAICENTMGSATCTCPDNRYEETTGTAGTNCMSALEFNCDGSKANISLLIPYWESKYINVNNVFVNDNCSGTTDGIWHKYRCNGTVTANTTHLIAAFRVADVIPVGGLSIYRLDTTVTCIQPALQNFTGNLVIHSEDTVVDPGIETAEESETSLQAEVFVGGYESSAAEGIRTGDMACIKLSDPNFSENIRTMIHSFHTSAPGASTTFTLLRDYCPVEVAGVAVETTNGGICFTMHRPHASTALQVKLVVNFCLLEDCPTPSCQSNQRNHILNERQQELQEISFTINIAPGDTCDRDCGTGACLLDDFNQQRCICSDNSILTEEGKCKVKGNEAEQSDGDTSANMMTIVIGLLSAAFLLCLLGFAAYWFTRRRQRKDHVNDIQLKMQEAYTNNIDKE